MQRQAVMVILRDAQGRFLMGKRSAAETIAPGYWAPISGTVEPGETERETVVRECLEEIGVTVEPIAKISEMDARDGSCRLHWWTARIIRGAAGGAGSRDVAGVPGETGEPRLITNELSEICWVAADELSLLTPSFEEDIALLQDVASRRFAD